jgi:hypothetical protein
MIEQFDCVALTHDVPDEGLKAGDIGAVVDIYGKHEAYHVEFVLTDGGTTALLLLEAKDVTRVGTDGWEYRPLAGTTLPHVTLTMAKLQSDD